jgi:hypothetical protein
MKALGVLESKWDPIRHQRVRLDNAYSQRQTEPARGPRCCGKAGLEQRGCVPPSTWGQVLDVPLHGMLVRSDGVEHDLVLATPHWKTVRIFECSGAIAAYGLGVKQIIGDPLVRDGRRAGEERQAAGYKVSVLPRVDPGVSTSQRP